MDNCEFAYQLKKEEICINPYHYLKIDQHQQQQGHQQPLTILVPKLPPASSDTSTISASYTLDDLSNTVPVNIQYNALK